MDNNGITLKHTKDCIKALEEKIDDCIKRLINNYNVEMKDVRIDINAVYAGNTVVAVKTSVKITI